MGNPYLTVYNAALSVGWGYCLWSTVRTLMKGGGTKEVWEAVELPLKISQGVALLEVVHSAVGLVKSPVAITALQVASRVFILFGIVNPLQERTTRGGVLLGRFGDFSLELNFTSLVSAWSIAEIIRYGFFAFKELGIDLYLMKWLRYTGFIVLYPVGVGSEISMIWLALPTIKETHMWSIDMPNTWNFGFDFYIMCWVAIASYIPFFPQLYFYMLSQRKKVLGGKPKIA